MSQDICEVCFTIPVTHVMYPILATDEERSNGPRRPVLCMCDDCAREAFESGEYEADDNE